MSKAVLSKLITVKVATLTLAATTAGGVALATTTGEIPGPFGHGHGRGHGAEHPREAALAALCRVYLAKKNHSPLPKPPAKPAGKAPAKRPTGSWTPHHAVPQDHGRPQPQRSGAPVKGHEHVPPRPHPTGSWTVRPHPTGTATFSSRPKPRHKAHPNPEKILAKAAGGADKITSFCTTLLSKQPSPKPRPHHPIGSPSATPSSTESPKTGSGV